MMNMLYKRNKLYVKYITMENCYLIFFIIFHNITVFTVFLNQMIRVLSLRASLFMVL